MYHYIAYCIIFYFFFIGKEKIYWKEMPKETQGIQYLYTHRQNVLHIVSCIIYVS